MAPDSTLSGLDEAAIFFPVGCTPLHPRLFKLSTSGALYQSMIESFIQNGNQFIGIMFTK
jgi:hypothetical protein